MKGTKSPERDQSPDKEEKGGVGKTVTGLGLRKR